MTNKEAIDIIKVAIAEIEWEYPMEYAAAFDMAVKALERQDVPDTNAGEWISVKDRMPNMDVDVLTYFRWGAFEIGRFDKDPDSLEYRWKFEDFNLYGDDMQDITNWMTLPEPPKEET